MAGLSRRYDREVAQAWRVIKAPARFTVDVVEFNVGKPEYFVQLRVYSSEIEPMNDPMRVKVMEYLALCQKVIYSYGIKCDLAGVEGSPAILPGKGK